jgi:hypothetical protein
VVRIKETKNANKILVRKLIGKCPFVSTHENNIKISLMEVICKEQAQDRVQ